MATGVCTCLASYVPAISDAPQCHYNENFPDV